MDITYMGEDLAFLVDFIYIMAFLSVIMIVGVIHRIVYPEKRMQRPRRATKKDKLILRSIIMLEVFVIAVSISNTIDFLTDTITYQEYAEIMIFGENALIYPYLTSIIIRFMFLTILGIPGDRGIKEMI